MQIALGTTNTKRYRYFWKYTDDSFVEQGIPISYYAHVHKPQVVNTLRYPHQCTGGDSSCASVGGRLPPFDPFPYGLLTMIVSLEAICLSTFVLISQNRFSDEADRRAELDLQIGLLAEHEITRVLQMLDAIQDKLGIENDADSELADLEMETRPEDVLAEIDRVHRQVKG
jgi:hypothetical protein